MNDNDFSVSLELHDVACDTNELFYEGDKPNEELTIEDILNKLKEGDYGEVGNILRNLGDMGVTDAYKSMFIQYNGKSLTYEFGSDY